MGTILGAIGLLGATSDPKTVAATAVRILAVGWVIVLPGALFALMMRSSVTYLPSTGFGIVFLGGFALVMVAAVIVRLSKAVLISSNQESSKDLGGKS